MRFRGSILIVLFAACLSGQRVSRSGVHPEDMDTACKPCTDFWRYVNGGWLDKNPVPGDKASWGTFGVLTDANRERIRTILEAAARSSGNKMGDLYASCMDTAAIDARGISPLQPDFDRIAAVRSLKDLNAVLTDFERVPRPGFANANSAVAAPFHLSSIQDRKNPERVVASISAGTVIFSMPDRDYYFRDDEKSRQTRAAFLEHVSKMLELTGTPHAAAEEQSRVVLSFETALAESVMTIAERRNP
jgi:predicted metalloendopeptidase